MIDLFLAFNTPFALDTTHPLVNPDPKTRAENPSFRPCRPALTPTDSSRRETGDGLLTSGVVRNESHILTCAVLTIHAGNCILSGQIDHAAQVSGTAAAPRRRCETNAARQVGHIMLWGVGRREAYQILRTDARAHVHVCHRLGACLQRPRLRSARDGSRKLRSQIRTVLEARRAEGGHSAVLRRSD